MNRIRIVCKNGMTAVHDMDTGEPIPNVRAVRFEHNGPYSEPILTLTFLPQEIAFESDAVETRQDKGHETTQVDVMQQILDCLQRIESIIDGRLECPR